MVNTTKSAPKSKLIQVSILTFVLLLLGGPLNETAFASHNSKISKKEMERKFWAWRATFDKWEPKIHIRPSSSPRTLFSHFKPLPKSIEKKTKRSTLISIMYFDGQHLKYDWKRDDIAEEDPIYAASMSKSIISYLVGKAFCEGRIESLEDTIGQYTDSFDGSFYENVKIIDALNMASGDGDLYPDSKQGATRWKYYVSPVLTDRLTVSQAILKLGNKKPRKKRFHYADANTDALSAVLVAISTEGFTEFANVNLADAAGFKYDSYFMADYDGVPHGFHGFWAARSDWLRAAIKIGEDFRSTECIGDYLRGAVENTVKTRNKFQHSHTRYGKKFWSKGILKKFQHIAMKGHGGKSAYIETAGISPKVIVILSMRSDYGEKDTLTSILK